MVYFVLFLVGQDLRVPSEVRGEPFSFIMVVGETVGASVRFFPLDSGVSVFPSALLSNQKATVVVGPVGRYRFLAYTSVDGRATEPVVFTVVIADGSELLAVPVGPLAVPVVPVVSVGPLAVSLAGIFGGIGEVGKGASARALAAVYRRGSVDVVRCRTLGDVYYGLRAQGVARLDPLVLIPIKQAICSDMMVRFGDDAGVVLSPELRVGFGLYLSGLATILEGLR